MVSTTLFPVEKSATKITPRIPTDPASLIMQFHGLDPNTAMRIAKKGELVATEKEGKGGTKRIIRTKKTTKRQGRHKVKKSKRNRRIYKK